MARIGGFGECTICFDADITTAAVPCGHIFACEPCIRAIASSDGICSICRGTFDGTNPFVSLFAVVDAPTDASETPAEEESVSGASDAGSKEHDEEVLLRALENHRLSLEKQRRESAAAIAAHAVSQRSAMGVLQAELQQFAEPSAPPATSSDYSDEEEEEAEEESSSPARILAAARATAAVRAHSRHWAAVGRRETRGAAVARAAAQHPATRDEKDFADDRTHPIFAQYQMEREERRRRSFRVWFWCISFFMLFMGCAGLVVAYLALVDMGYGIDLALPTLVFLPALVRGVHWVTPLIVGFISFASTVLLSSCFGIGLMSFVGGTTITAGLAWYMGTVYAYV